MSPLSALPYLFIIIARMKLQVQLRLPQHHAFATCHNFQKAESDEEGNAESVRPLRRFAFLRSTENTAQFQKVGADVRGGICAYGKNTVTITLRFERDMSGDALVPLLSLSS